MCEAKWTVSWANKVRLFTFLILVFAVTPYLSAADGYEDFAKKLRFEVTHEEDETMKAAMSKVLDRLPRTTSKASKVYNEELVKQLFVDFYKKEFIPALANNSSKDVAEFIRFPMVLSTATYSGELASTLTGKEFSDKYMRKMERNEFLKSYRNIFDKDVRLLLSNIEVIGYLDDYVVEYRNKIEFLVTIRFKDKAQNVTCQTFSFSYYVEPFSYHASIKLEGIATYADPHQ